MTGGEIAFLALVLAGFGYFMTLMAWCTFNPDGGKSKRTVHKQDTAGGSRIAHA